MYSSKKDKKDDDDSSLGNVFSKMQKTTVLQEARIFNQSPVNAKKCALTLTKILYLLNQGETLTTQEATDVFFHMTRLFSSKDITLRRLLYLGIKELSKIAENVYVVTSSLTGDMKQDLYRPQALRTLCMITDASTFPGIERFMKQSIVDKNPAVSSAALVSAIHISKILPEGVKRCVNEVQAALNSDISKVQYLALGLLYYIKKSDRLAVSKLVTKYIQSGLKLNLANCMLIRIAAKLVEEENNTENQFYYFIESCLKNKSDTVAYEAANAIVNLNCATQSNLRPAISALQVYLGCQRPTLRFAAVRTLNRIAMTQPTVVMSCNVDLENLITDSNRSIATLAITTLLKTGNEASVERLIKIITTFMNEISDEFKIIVVRATRQLCQKFPKKHNTMMFFLSNMLREEGGFEYKKCLVDTIIDIIEDIPESKEDGLAYLCEFIEDCEPVEIAIKILHLLGKEGPKTSRPSKYIRYIYNRLILECAPIRCAAVCALAKFGAHCDDLLPNILILLERSCLDTDDEVRDRATYYLNILKQRKRELIENCITNPFQLSIVSLERALKDYLDKEDKQLAFDIKSVPIQVEDLAEKEEKIDYKSSFDNYSNADNTSQDLPTSKAPTEKLIITKQDIYEQQIAEVLDIKQFNLGPIIKSSSPIELTESETEYLVQCVKHMYKNHLILQFDCTNTLDDQILDDVSIVLKEPAGFKRLASVNCDTLKYNVSGRAYVLYEIDVDGLNDLVGTFDNVIMKYKVKDCDPATGLSEDGEEGYDDEYPLEDFEVAVADYMQRVTKNNFQTTWDELGSDKEVQETYSLNELKDLEEATKNVICFMGMQPCERSDKLSLGKQSTHHSLKLAGLFRGEEEVLVQIKLAIDVYNPEAGVTMQLSVRCQDLDIGEFIAGTIQ